ncbi:MAG: hypothetical protein QXJ17_05390 [Nitrososphaeria archaeon]
MSNFISELREAYNYCGTNFRRHVVMSFSTSISIFIVCMILLPLSDLILKTFLSSMLFILCFYLLVTYPYLKYSQHRFLISYYGFLALSDLNVITEFSSLFHACYHLLLADYPIISNLFRKVVVDGIRGEDLFKRLKEVAYIQPSTQFKEGLLSILIDLSPDKSGRLKLNDEAIQIYKNLSSQIEMRFSIIMGVTFFAPILLILFISMYVQTVFEVIVFVAFSIFFLSLVYMVLTRSLSKHKMV